MSNTMTEQLVLPGIPPVDDSLRETKGSQLPKPVGFCILCAVPEVSDTYDGGILKVERIRKVEEHSTVVLFVLDMGDLCYKDESRFPSGPWCKKGDFILVRAYAGTRIRIHGKEFRIIHDDSVEAVVDDPRGITRV